MLNSCQDRWSWDLPEETEDTEDRGVLFRLILLKEEQHLKTNHGAIKECRFDILGIRGGGVLIPLTTTKWCYSERYVFV